MILTRGQVFAEEGTLKILQLERKMLSENLKVDKVEELPVEFTVKCLSNEGLLFKINEKEITRRVCRYEKCYQNCIQAMEQKFTIA